MTPVQIANFVFLFLFTNSHLSYQHAINSSVIDNDEEATTTTVTNKHQACRGLQEYKQFGSLLGAGRPLSFPFGAGYILAVVNEKLWPVSTKGFQHVFQTPLEEMTDSYSSLLCMLQQDDNVQISSRIYLINNTLPSNDNLKRLETKQFFFPWGDNDAWFAMNEQLDTYTDGRLSGKLIPSSEPWGELFHSGSTKAAIVNTFHYQSTWEQNWDNIGFSIFSDSGNVPFLSTKGIFRYTENDDYTAISIPFEGLKKRLVFVLPRYNITKYFRADDVDGAAPIEEIPFPKSWMDKHVQIQVPKFSFAKMDQFGKQMDQFGVNETFCTTIFDRNGTFPYYLRPLVQVNYVNFSEEGFEMSSATGTGVQKFNFGDDIFGTGYPKKTKSTGKQSSSASHRPVNSNDVRKSSSNDSLVVMSFNRPFLWYVHDETVGPMFFGVLQTLKNILSPTADGGNDVQQDLFKLFMWSCKSFTQTPPVF